MSEPTGVLAGAAIGQISVNVDDVERATAFYRDKLGLAHLFSAGGMAFFATDGARLMLARPEAEFSGPSSILYFRVADIEAAHAALVGAGVESRHGSRLTHKTDASELWLAFFTDGEGNTDALMEERATAV